MIALWTTGAIGAAILFCTLYAYSRRRATPHWEIPYSKLPPVSDLLPTITGLTGGAAYSGNEVEIYHDGALWDALLDDIAAARRSVHLETFVWKKGELEAKIVRMLLRKAREGVQVRLILDAIGAKDRSPARVAQLKSAGVEVFIFHPLKLRALHRINERTHRKLTIMDGRIGYTMGHGVSDRWLGNAQDPEHFRDCGVRVTGPAVHGMQVVFARNWLRGTRCLLAGDACFPALAATGTTRLHLVSSTAGQAYSDVSLAYTVAIASARNEVLIQNPYFAPDSGTIDLLAEAVRRGVDVQLMVPGRHTDSGIVRRAGYHLYKCLLDSGVRVYEYEPTLLHQKVMVVDGHWSHVGSTNFDCRSLELNDEVGIGILDCKLAQELRDAFCEDLSKCVRITGDAVTQRSFVQRSLDAGAYLVHDQL